MGTAVENEFKYTSDRDIDAGLLVERLEVFLKDRSVPFKKKVKRSKDLYFDSADMELFNSERMLRMKTSENGKIKLTVKRPISNEFGMMSREEIEAASDGSMDDIVRFAGKHLPGIQIGEEPTLAIECERTAFDYLDGSGIKLSFDRCIYVHGDASKTFYEIELESMNESTERDFDEIGMCGFIEETLGFEPVTKSKYQRGIEWIRASDISE